ncbi:hypothetical protein I5677_13130 [Mobilitalea sibirica]|uniref:N-terminal domain of peptidoglycan hydrolase CwlO-containing protein n=1 Tax=Mobilitalea sibirica TaxID=1462919 RepID=A0A8J7HBL2_9FIRM|nr:hypothetical protein [Mobilitalea sibirica]MBH1941840.1 hypothetical protein [Mobilitalea sibirica]
MLHNKKLKKCFIYLSMFSLIILIFPNQASGEVAPITQTQEKLMDISEEEQEVLKTLFALTQEIEEMEREELRLTDEIKTLEAQIQELERKINDKQEEFDHQLSVLEKVLISYQKGGPASYFEMLLSSKDFTTFLMNINLMKDISHNLDELLASIDEGKLILTEEKEKLTYNMQQLEVKKEELKEPIANKQRLRKEQEIYLERLEEEKERYSEHLSNLELMWDDLKIIFSEIVGEFTRIIGEGHFTMEDMNISFQFLSIKGALHEDTFNTILKEHSTLPEIVFHFDTDKVLLEVPEKNLILKGKFSIVGKSTLVFEVESGSFYQMPLEQASIDELFKQGPLLIDFETIVGDMVLIDINLDTVKTVDGYLEFILKTSLRIF